MSISADDWEVVDDDGFIYKRRKKQSPAEGPDNIEELKLSESQHRIKEALALRKKIAILESQKIKYSAEIETWQRLLTREALEILPNEPLIADSPESSEHESKDVDSDLNLQVQVEMFEELIERLKKLREKGEDVANVLEKTIETKTKGLIDEVTLLKNSPRFLITGLTSGVLPLGIKASAVSTEVGRLLAQSPEGRRQ